MYVCVFVRPDSVLSVLASCVCFKWYSGRQYGVNSYALKTITHTPKIRPGYRFYWFLASCVFKPWWRQSMSHWYSGRSFDVNSYALKTIISHILQKQDLDTGFTGDSQCRSGPVVGRTGQLIRTQHHHFTHTPKQDLDTGFTGFWLRVCGV